MEASQSGQTPDPNTLDPQVPAQDSQQSADQDSALQTPQPDQPVPATADNEGLQPQPPEDERERIREEAQDNPAGAQPTESTDPDPVRADQPGETVAPDPAQADTVDGSQDAGQA